MFKKILKELSLPESYISITLGFLIVIVAGLLLYNNISKKPLSNQVNENSTANVTEGVNQKKENDITTLPTTHTIAQNESLWSIAEKYYKSGYNWVTIAKANNLVNPDTIAIGQKLEIPKSETIQPVEANISATATSRSTQHVVVRGENLWNIAVSEYGNGFMWSKIASANHLVNPRVIHAGNVLVLPRD
jgi:nucleoid-associated protein YgaU